MYTNICLRRLTGFKHPKLIKLMIFINIQLTVFHIFRLIKIAQKIINKKINE